MCWASSFSLGDRPSFASSVLIASLSLLALLRTRRGTQSIVRSSSSIAPRIRGTQYVSNLTPRLRSNASIASISPNTPAEIRSSSSTPSGRRDQIRSALYLTSGREFSPGGLRTSPAGSARYAFQPSALSVSTCVTTGSLPDVRQAGAARPAAVTGSPARPRRPRAGDPATPASPGGAPTPAAPCGAAL